MHRLKKTLKAGGIAAVLLAVVIAGIYLWTGRMGSPLAGHGVVERPCPDGFAGARCGYVRVPLDYAHPDAEQIEIGFLHYARLWGFGGPKRALYIVGGGPGAPISEELHNNPMRPIRIAFPREDLIAVEARGIGLSTHVACTKTVASKIIGHAAAPEEWPDIVASCGEEIGPQRVHYSTANTARDFERVREALAIEELDILAFSYGTNLMTVYASLFPDHIRTMILDGAYPLRGALFDPNTYAGTRRQFTQMCERSKACKGGDVWAALGEVSQTLRQSPRALKSDDPKLVLPAGAKLDVRVLAGLVQAWPVTTHDKNGEVVHRMAVIGALLKARSGDWAALESLAVQRVGFPSDSIGSEDVAAGASVLYAVNCGEKDRPWGLSDPFDVRQQKLDAALAALPTDRFAPFTPYEWAWRTTEMNDDPQCFRWPAVPPGAKVELRSSFEPHLDRVPVLVMGGDLDMQTPLEEARAAAAQFPLVQFAHFRHVGHATTPSSACALGLVHEFVQNRRLEDPDKCLEAEAGSYVIEVAKESKP